MNSTWWTNPAQLDDQQKEVVSLPKDGNYLVTGPAGCGKTNLLLLRASYLYKAGLKDIVVLTFARSLKEFIAAGASNYSFSEDKIQTYVRWANNLMRENGLPCDEKIDFDDKRADLLEGLKQLAGLDRPENKFDSILIDEAQDYTVEEINTIKCFTDRLFLVGDSKQRIQSKDSETLSSIAQQGVEKRELKFHYRNGLKICRVADGITGLLDSEFSMEATSNYDEESFPSLVRTHENKNLDEQIQILIEDLPNQLTAYPDELIGVICPRREELEMVSSGLEVSSLGGAIQVLKENQYVITDKRPIVVTTVHSAKGLEFRAVHMISADKIKNFRLQKKLAYTGVTRCKTSLTVYHEANLPGYFEKGLQACLPEPEAPILDDLFD